MRPKRSLGQNFLVDGNLQRAIVAALDPRPDDEVLEIGPGTGALTRHLVGRAGRLVLVELDDDLAARLTLDPGARPDVEVVHADILEMDLADLSRDVATLKVVGNIPYNRTSDIVFHLLRRPRPAEILIMVQREVAERMAASPGTRTYGALTVGVQSVARVERVLKVPRTAFRPVPRVDSAVVRIVPDRPPRLEAEEETRLRRLTRAVFQRRRKQLQRTLRDAPGYRLDREAVKELESRSGLDLTARPEALSPAELLALARLLHERARPGR